MATNDRVGNLNQTSSNSAADEAGEEVRKPVQTAAVPTTPPPPTGPKIPLPPLPEAAAGGDGGLASASTDTHGTSPQAR